MKAPHPPRCKRCGHPLHEGGRACARCGPAAAPPAAGGQLLGILDLPRGAWFVLVHPGLWPYLVIPFLLNLGLWVGAFVLCRWGYREYAQPWIQEQLGTGFLSGTVEVLLVIAYVLVWVFLFRPVLFVVGSPFYDFLSEGVEHRYLGGPSPGTDGGLAGLLQEILRALVVALQTALWILLWTVLWLPLLIVPVVGALLYFLAMARLCTFELLDFTFARKGYRLREKVAFHRSIFWRSFGLGGLLNLVLVIPVVGWLAYPCGVAGAALLYCDSRK